MRKLTITFLVLTIIFFSACASQTETEAKPTPQPAGGPLVIESVQISGGTRVEITYKIYGRLPKNREETERLELPCWVAQGDRSVGRKGDR